VTIAFAATRRPRHRRDVGVDARPKAFCSLEVIPRLVT
jgi:hypothetical protein